MSDDHYVDRNDNSGNSAKTTEVAGPMDGDRARQVARGMHGARHTGSSDHYTVRKS